VASIHKIASWWRCAGLNRSPKIDDQSIYMLSKSENFAKENSLSKISL